MTSSPTDCPSQNASKSDIPIFEAGADIKISRRRVPGSPARVETPIKRIVDLGAECVTPEGDDSGSLEPASPVHTPVTTSVANLRTSFEQPGRASPQNKISKHSAGSQTPPLPRRSSMRIQGRNMTTLTTRHKQHIQAGERTSAETRTTPDTSVHNVSPNFSLERLSVKSQGKSATRMINQNRESYEAQATPCSILPSRRSSVLHSSPVHPLLRQKQGSYTIGPDVQEPRFVQNDDRHKAEVSEVPREGSSSKVASLRQLYDLPSASTPFLPCDRKQDDNRPSKWASSTASLVALSAAIGLATYQAGSHTPSPTHSTPGTQDRHDNTPPSDESRGSPTRQPRNKLKKKQRHESPIKDKISVFENLTRPASRPRTLASRAKTFDVAGTARQKGEEGTSGMRKLAENGTKMWRRLSGSFEKEKEKVCPEADGEDAPKTPRGPSKDVPDRKGQRKRVVTAHGLAPRRNPRPSARESTFFVEGTISRIPRGVVDKHRLRANMARSSSGTNEQRDAAPTEGHPVLPDFNFNVDGTSDMLGYFEQNFNINFSITGVSASHCEDTSQEIPASSSTGNKHRGASSAAYPTLSRSSHIVSKSRASPVLSIHEAHGDTITAHNAHQQPRNTEHRKKTPASAVASQAVWESRRRQTTAGGEGSTSRSNNEVWHARPLRPASAVPVRESEEDVVVAKAQCGLAHPRPSRVLNLKRFVGYCRERGVGRAGVKL